MALFSRRPKKSTDQPSSQQPAPQPLDEDVAPAVETTPDSGPAPAEGTAPAAGTATDAAADADTATEAATEATATPAGSDPAEATPPADPAVQVSLSTFQGLGPKASAPVITPRAPGPETAPTDAEVVPGLRDNVLVREALAQLSIPATATDLLNVARQLLQGHLFLRVKGDARALLAEGKRLPLAIANVGDKQYALAYSGGRALQTSLKLDGDADTSAMGQPVLAIIRHVLAGPYAGLIIDHGSQPQRAVLPRELLEKMLEKFDEQHAVKSLLAGERTPETAASVVAALQDAPLWVAVGKGPSDRPGIAEGRSKDGSRYLEVYTHPLEVAVMGRRDQAAPVTAKQLATALNGDTGLTGVIVDPAGPWIRLTRDDLQPVLALIG